MEGTPDLAATVVEQSEELGVTVATLEAEVVSAEQGVGIRPVVGLARIASLSIRRVEGLPGSCDSKGGMLRAS